MTKIHGHGPTAGQLAAALSIGTIGILMVGVQPILLGELVDSGLVTLEGVGPVAMAEIVAIGLGVALSNALLPGKALRIATVVAALLAAAFDLATLHASGTGGLLAVRALAGFAEGTLIWGTTGVIVRTADPARAAGVFFVVQTLVQAAVGVVLANFVIPRAGWQGGFAALAALSLLPCLLTWLQPRRLEALPPACTTGFRWHAGTVLPLLVVFVQLATLGAFWAYLEPLGKAVGFDSRTAQTLVSLVLVMQVCGGSVAASLVRRAAPAPALLVASLALAAATLGVRMLAPGAGLGFSVACAVFGFFWLFMMPFHVGLAMTADPGGRLASLVPAAQLLGSAAGPLLASLFVKGDDAQLVPEVSAALAVSAAMLLVALRSPRFAPPGKVADSRPS